MKTQKSTHPFAGIEESLNTIIAVAGKYRDLAAIMRKQPKLLRRTVGAVAIEPIQDARAALQEIVDAIEAP